MEDIAETPQTIDHLTNSPRVIFLIIGLTVLVLGLTYAAFLGQNRQQPVPTPPITPAPTPVDETVYTEETRSANWKTYRDIGHGFEFKYPPTLYPDSQIPDNQVFLFKKDATATERIDFSDHIVEISTDGYVKRFEAYHNNPENSIVKGYGDVILRRYTISGYKTVEYGYDEETKAKEIKGKDEALRSGASVGRVYFPRGLMINKGGTIIEISTLSYHGDFKNTFDQILSTFKFLNATPTPTCIPRPACLDQVPRCLMPEPNNMCPPKTKPTPKPTPRRDQVVCTQEVKLCPDGSYVSRTGPNCEFAPCP